MDIFEKCERFTLADQLRNEGIYPYFHALETRQDVKVGIDPLVAQLIGKREAFAFFKNVHRSSSHIG